MARKYGKPKTTVHDNLGTSKTAEFAAGQTMGVSGNGYSIAHKFQSKGMNEPAIKGTWKHEYTVPEKH